MSAQQISVGLPDPFFTDNSVLLPTPFASSMYIPAQNVLSRTGSQYLSASQVQNPLVFLCSGGGAGLNSTYQLPSASSLFGSFQGNVNQNSILYTQVFNLSPNGGTVTLAAGTGGVGSATFTAQTGGLGVATGATGSITMHGFMLQWTGVSVATGPSYSVF
jgi:hypothetical protein